MDLVSPLLALCSMIATPQGDQPARLLSFDRLEARLDDPDLRILDVRPRDSYDAGHIPGALWVDASAVEATASVPGALEDPKAWGDWAAGLGLGPDTAVYVYDANRQKDAARFWWLLSYLGVEEVGLIDGGFPLWQSEGRPVSTDEPEVDPRPFPVRLRPDRYASRSDVLDAIESGSAQVVDARSEAEHLGEEARSTRGGRVPTACHLEWATLVDEQGRFLPEEAIRPRLEAIGLEPGRPVITHCQGGGRASVDAFVLQRLGFPSRNYYLGWSDWGNAGETPVESGAAPRRP
ncbi:Thiosulfate sulfurtransferase [Tautonia plasticadhaerens]|uniref:Thiosulfate sulfurtransferase n=2 Tax=Tautonia plasticadhaerens TaxID=2527974 RepID=A0A518H765_9BACT|nr:Thiosulfate sulfurtransferase [Tautonia plasticadhaerens]